MKRSLIKQFIRCGLTGCLLLRLEHAGAQFVKVTSEIETVFWQQHESNGTPPPVSVKRETVQCLVGTNTWLIQTPKDNEEMSWWYTGTNIIEQSVITRYPTDRLELFQRNHPELIGSIGRPSTRILKSPDGNLDTALTGPSVNIPWLAFCSGPYLKVGNRPVAIPSQFWIYHLSGPLNYPQKPLTFEDDLGLPKTFDLATTNGQPALQYRTGRSTNFLGWNFPLEFYLAQYRSTVHHWWELDLTAKGKITGIEVGARPEIQTKN